VTFKYKKKKLETKSSVNKTKRRSRNLTNRAIYSKGGITLLNINVGGYNKEGGIAKIKQKRPNRGAKHKERNESGVPSIKL